MRERPLDGVRELVVVRRESVADGVVSLTLRHPSGAPLPRWEAGAHIDLLLGVGLERQYSLCGDPADPFRWRIAVLREPEGRGGSLFVHERIAEGDTVRVRGPRNRFRLEAAPPGIASSPAASASRRCCPCSQRPGRPPGVPARARSVRPATGVVHGAAARARSASIRSAVSRSRGSRSRRTASSEVRPRGPGCSPPPPRRRPGPAPGRRPSAGPPPVPGRRPRSPVGAPGPVPRGAGRARPRSRGRTK
jgi:hypothetical protein